jgi:hypothetical protein
MRKRRGIAGSSACMCVIIPNRITGTKKGRKGYGPDGDKRRENSLHIINPIETALAYVPEDTSQADTLFGF